MSTLILDQSLTGPVVQGVIPASLPLPEPNSKLSLFIHAPGILFGLEAPMVGSPVIEHNKITARFIVDHNVYLDLNLTGQSVKQENLFEAGQFSLFYQIEERRPRAHFVADTIMAVMGLAGRLDLKISEPKVSTNLNFAMPLLEISKMLRRRQTAYRLMFVEEVMGKEFSIPSGIWDKEVEDIAFIYHALVDRSFVWPRSGSFTGYIPATPKFASSFAQIVQPFPFSLPVDSLSETVLGQTVNLGRATVTIEDATVKKLEEVQAQLEARDGRQVAVEIESLSGQVKYEFAEMPDASHVTWGPKIQALINLEPYLDAAMTERYHALAAATLDGLTEEEKEAVTTRPDLGEAFLIDDSDGE